LFTSLGRIDPATIRSTSFAAWRDAHSVRPRIRQLLSALARVSTYAADLERLSAGAAVAQIQSAIAGGVLYVDGGWQTLVDALRGHAEAAGATIRSHHRAVAVERTDNSLRVRLADGSAIAAASVVLAVAPSESAEL